MKKVGNAITSPQKGHAHCSAAEEGGKRKRKLITEVLEKDNLRNNRGGVSMKDVGLSWFPLNKLRRYK